MCQAISTRSVTIFSTNSYLSQQWNHSKLPSSSISKANDPTTKPLDYALQAQPEALQYSHQEHTHCLTITACLTRYPTAEPLIDGWVDRVGQALVQTWISYFGVPLRITTNLGKQFKPDFFRKLVDRTKSYHPQLNGFIERFHRQLSAIPLGLRAVFEEEVLATPAKNVFGEPVQHPSKSSNKTIEAPELFKTLRKHLKI